jgi:hypothetical protein
MPCLVPWRSAGILSEYCQSSFVVDSSEGFSSHYLRDMLNKAKCCGDPLAALLAIKRFGLWRGKCSVQTISADNTQNKMSSD